MILRLIPALRAAIAEQWISYFDAGAGPAIIEFYTGIIPTNLGDTLTTQVKLGTLTCSDPAATQTAGVIAFGTITQDSGADAGGTAAWAYIKDGSGAIVNAVDVSNAAGDGLIKLNTTTVVAGGPILINSLEFTVAGA
ncbi:hypothetical protein IB236_17420 [Acidovorax sp. ACV02]|uniref:hypothetical protein n=1 Tax=Acidovorax sp. ACV02 TaxID=2769310 RepID=UPI00177E9132|nr:hypothetical protein [Acidovorax sp. ACV02]MBD9407128.1 hypothetical protein [Acidovorax sp. ACV02]